MSATLDLRNKKDSLSLAETRPEIPTIGITRPDGDDSTALATTEFVQRAIHSGSDVLSVFGRTGNVLAQDGDYTVAQVTGAAPELSPAFTGTPTAPTPGYTDDSTLIATTDFVKKGAPVLSVAGKIGNVLLVESDIANLVSDLGARELTANKDQESGYAGLDTSTLLKVAEFPAFVGDVITTQGTITTKFNSISGAVILADNLAGADWGAKVQAADTQLGAAAGEIWITQGAGTSAPASDITLNTGHVLRFLQGGTWNLGSKRILIPAGATRVAVVGSPCYQVKLQYNGSDFIIVAGAVGSTLTEFIILRDLFLACQSTSDGAGCIKLLCTLFTNIQECELAANGAYKQYGILSDGTGSFSAYTRVDNTTVNLCYFGMKFTGSSNSNLISGGSITGIGSHSVSSGSIGINIDNGDSNNILSCDLESYDIGLRINSSRNLINCARFEGATITTHCLFTASATSNKVFSINTSGTLTISNLGGATNQFLYSDQALELQTNKDVANGYAGLDASALLKAAEFPAPTSSSFGGVKSLAAVTHNFLTSIGTNGVPTQAQPASTDLSDLPIPVSSGGTGSTQAGTYGIMIARLAAAVTVTGTVTETSAFTGSIPAGLLKTTSRVILRFGGRVTTGVGAITLTIRFGAAGSGITGTIVVDALSLGSSGLFNFGGELTIINNGSLSSQNSWDAIRDGSAFLNSVNRPSSINTANASEINVDFTVPTNNDVVALYDAEVIVYL